MEQTTDVFGTWIDFGMAIAAVIGGIAIFMFPYLRDLLKKTNFNTDSNVYPKDFNWGTHTGLHEKLTELRVQTDCARTQIVQFHNSGQFLDGISMKKMSLTHESLATGTSSEMPVKKDLLLSLCVEGLNLLKENKSDLYIVDQLDDSWCKKFMQASNVIAFSFLPIRKENEISGYVMCQWCSWSKTDNIEEKEMAIFLESARDLIEFIMQQQIGMKGKK